MAARQGLIKRTKSHPKRLRSINATDVTESGLSVPQESISSQNARGNCEIMFFLFWRRSISRAEHHCSTVSKTVRLMRPGLSGECGPAVRRMWPCCPENVTLLSAESGYLYSEAQRSLAQAPKITLLHNHRPIVS